MATTTTEKGAGATKGAKARKDTTKGKTTPKKARTVPEPEMPEDIWEQIPGENADQYAKFCAYRDMVRPIDMWMVLYTREFGIDEGEDEAFRKYLEPFNGIIMWTWHESWVPRIPEKFEIFKRLTPNQRRMFGCYLYNFGEKKKATSEAVRWQLDFYREKLYSGEAEGVVLHTNTMADLDHPAYDTAIEWLERHGDEEID